MNINNIVLSVICSDINKQLNLQGDFNFRLTGYYLKYSIEELKNALRFLHVNISHSYILFDNIEDVLISEIKYHIVDQECKANTSIINVKLKIHTNKRGSKNGEL